VLVDDEVVRSEVEERAIPGIGNGRENNAAVEDLLRAGSRSHQQHDER
jgi:hypothetical protein